MSLLDAVSEAVRAWTQPAEVGPFVVVPTYSVYPSNGLVQVYIEGSSMTFEVSDGGGAYGSFRAAGGADRIAKKHLTEIAGRSALKVNRAGWIYTRAEGPDELIAAISLIAEVSRTASEGLLRLFKPGQHPDFRRELDHLLAGTFKPQVYERRAKLVGASNKPHTFDYAIRIPDLPILVVDAVVPEANSINKVVVSHIDLRHARSDVEQRIVYDDRVAWSSADLALLTVGAPPLAFSAFPMALSSLGLSLASRLMN